MKYDVDYFIAKFEAIPDALWITGCRGVMGYPEKCALGHCGGVIARALSDLFKLEIGHRVWYVNDGGLKAYLQPTPKQRILAALRDIKAKQEADKPTPEYVQVPVPLMLMDRVQPAWCINAGLAIGLVIVTLLMTQTL